jgi:hypothetical protein
MEGWGNNSAAAHMLSIHKPWVQFPAPPSPPPTNTLTKMQKWKQKLIKREIISKDKGHKFSASNNSHTQKLAISYHLHCSPRF